METQRIGGAKKRIRTSPVRHWRLRIPRSFGIALSSRSHFRQMTGSCLTFSIKLSRKPFPFNTS